MKLTLPSGREVVVGAGTANVARTSLSKLLFAEARDRFASGAVTLRDARGADIAIDSLPLADFHALRAILVRLGFLAEESVSIDCRNCGETITHRPSSALPLGPFEDGELHDLELDTTLPFDVPHAVPHLGNVILAPRTLAEAAPLHAALRRRSFRITPSVIRAMGIASLGKDEDPARIASVLMRASEKTWASLTDSFLEAHYPPRLFSIAPCPHCGARNDVDAPYDREFEPSDGASHDASAHEADTAEEAGIDLDSNAQSFPSFEEFDRITTAIAGRYLRDPSTSDVTLVVEGDVPACDDGGEPLLGSYVPGYEGDMSSPSRAPEITLFYRTFRAIWDEEGPYDWRAEIEETIAHELEHHRADLAGDDPMDDDERAEIAHEQGRVLGKRALARGEVRALIADVRTFLIRTWPIWILLLLATLAVAYGEVR